MNGALTLREESDPRLVFVAGRLLRHDPLDRGEAVTGARWPIVLASLRLASQADGVALVGPVAAALRGHPVPPTVARVSVVGSRDDRSAIRDQLRAAGAVSQALSHTADPTIAREKWLASGGASLVIDWLPRGRNADLRDLLADSDAVPVPAAGIDSRAGTVRLPSVGALRARARASASAADRALVPGLDAIRAATQATVERARAEPPARLCHIEYAAATIDRSDRAELLELTVPCTGTMAVLEHRAVADALRRLATNARDPRSLRAVTVTVSAAGDAIRVTAAASPPVLDSWLSSGDLVAAIVAAVDETWRSGSR